MRLKALTETGNFVNVYFDADNITKLEFHDFLCNVGRLTYPHGKSVIFDMFRSQGDQLVASKLKNIPTKNIHRAPLFLSYFLYCSAVKSTQIQNTGMSESVLTDAQRTTDSERQTD